MRAQTVSLVLLALLVGANANGIISINKAISVPSVNVDVSASHSGIQITKSVGDAAPAPVKVEAVQKPETKPAPQPERKPETKPAPQPEKKPETKPAPQPEKKPETKPAPQPERKPETKPAPQPAVQAVPKPAAQPKAEAKVEKVEVQAEKPAFQKQIEAIVATKQAEVAARQAPRQEAAAAKTVSINLGHGGDASAGLQKSIVIGRRLAHFGGVTINKDVAMPTMDLSAGKGIQITKSIGVAAPAPAAKVEKKVEVQAAPVQKAVTVQAAAPTVQKAVSVQAAAPHVQKSISMAAPSITKSFSFGKGAMAAPERVQARQADSTGKGISISIGH